MMDVRQKIGAELMRLPARGARGARTLSRWLRRGGRGMVAMEFAILSVPFFIMFLGTMEVAYDLFVQSELDNAVNIAARSVQVGSSQVNAGTTSAQFIAKYVCPNLSSALDCSLLTVGVSPVPVGTNYFSSPVDLSVAAQTAATKGTGFATCAGGRMMALKAWYDGPTFLGSLVPYFATIWNGQIVHLTASSAGFVNEFFSGGQSVGGGC
jgi:Flp pilus assembly protein TadG